VLRIPEQIRQDIKEYKNRVNGYKKGSIEAIRFKTFRVPMGVYEQRKKETYMTRVRVAGGVISLQQLQKISEVADRYAHGKVHFTTRQDVQLHGVTIEDTVNIMEELLEVGMVTRGTGGNTPRNVACSPLSGVAVDEVFDVTPYAVETTNYLLQDPTVYNLPRKFKIAYSNSREDTANATIADLGFIAKIQAGKKAFEVYGGGGLGGNSRVSLKLEEAIPAEEVLYHVQAMKELFEKEGDRSNKHKARIRHIVHRIGEEEFRKMYRQQVEKVKSERKLELEIPEENTQKTVGKTAQSRSNLLFEQKEKGLYSVYIHPENGNLSTNNLNKILSFLNNLGYAISIRLTSTQGFFVRDLNGEDADRLLDIISEFISPFDIDNSVACAGAATCQLGLCLSQNLLSAIKERFKNAEDEVKEALPKIFISGCPNSCGQHQKGKIGFSGKAQRTEHGLIPMYTVYFGGNVGADKAVLGTPQGDLPAKRIPEFLYTLANLKQKSGNSSFEEFLEKEKETIAQLIKEYGDVESIEKNSDLYFDFGAEEEFSLKGRGPGECSAGVLDVIQLDLSNADRYIEEFKADAQSLKLYQAGLSAARALLILKGIDTNKEREIFEEFNKHFIETGYVKRSIQKLIDNFIDFKLGDLESLSEYYSEVEYLVSRVKALYSSLNSQLEITLPKEDVQEQNISDSHKEKEILKGKVVDFRGVKCPINFVKVKIELSKIAPGETIGFYLDDGEPIQNVPKSVEAEGHEIVSIDAGYDGYNLLTVKKKV
jgi:sulfite reductase (ferredoxin)